ncbi:hypothetical protein [Pluralibacter gergoviae]|uniref:hypothetical protein n=1 Tax=Pluralibacter gergoviae TaxID=61647 RepID=UPI00069E5494|nr:hypothetical protein [Pluralibacter gergoviae]
MTLLEILVKELPWKGGWPVGVNYIAQDSDWSIYGFEERPELEDGHEWLDGTSGGWLLKVGILAESSDKSTSVITRKQYEAALDDSKKMAWNGEGLPPVGCECEWEDKTGWFPVKIKYLSEWVIVFSGLTMDGEEVDIAKNLYADDVKFRPIRSEEERKRDESLAGLKKSLGHASDLFDVMRIYSAIAAGKIPHVKIV